MSTLEGLLDLAATGYACGLEWKLRGSRDGAEFVAMLVAGDLKVGEIRFKAERARLGSGVPALVVRAEGAAGGGSIGIVVFMEGPGGTVWLRVPENRGGAVDQAWPPDSDGRLFAQYLHALRQEYEKLGYTSVSSTLKARSIVDDALQQLAAAEEAPSYAAVGNMCRAALIALADEVYESHMLPQGKEAPKGDDAATKLKYAIRHYLAGSSETYTRAIETIAKGTWEMACAFLHRKNALREEAEICVEQTAILIEALARLALKEGSP